MMNMGIIKGQPADFLHPVIDEPVWAIGGEYVFTREDIMVVNGCKVLYYSGYFVVDRSCCGVGGCACALVAGVVDKWKYKTDKDGRPVSRVRPVLDPEVKKRVTAMIQEQDPLIQVSFMPAAGSRGF